MKDWPPISELVESVKKGEIKALDLVTKSLDLAEDNKELNTILCFNEKAKEQAIKIDNLVKSGEKLGKLAGVPFLVKDNILTKGIETTAGSNILKGFIPPISATVVELLENEGAILIGKTNLDSFGHGSSTENSDFGVTRNPHDSNRVSGGSSGGSAAAVSLGIVPFSIGTDTGGSIRQPASFCGCVGYKPTYGLVSRSGVIAMASSTDTIGPLTSKVDDAGYILDIIAGVDEKDSTTIDRELNYSGSGTELKGKKFGIIREHLSEGVDQGVRDQINLTVDKIKSSGGIVEDVSLPILDKALAAYYVIMPAEVSSNLSRYDGIRYGLSAQDTRDLEELYKTTRSRGFNDEAKRRIIIGTYVLSSGYYDAYYKKAQTVRTLIVEAYKKAFENYDFLLGPVTPATAFEIGQNTNDPLKMYLEDVMTIGPSLAGIPAISLPVGKVEKLPVGIQICANQKQDSSLIAVAKEIEEIVGYNQ